MNDLMVGKNVLITGAGRNIGRGIALEMGAAGAGVYFTELDPSRSEKLEAEFRTRGYRGRGFLADIAKAGDRDRLLDALREERSEIDVLVNNVGVHSNDRDRGRRERVSRSVEDVFRTNVLGPFALTSRITDAMRRRKAAGSILFITSIHQWVVKRDPPYSASKAALGMLVKELALELAASGIRVNGIAPGYIEVDDKGRPIRHRYTPLYGTSIDPAYIGRTAVYLSSDYFSKYTTGTVVKIDAGLSLYNHSADEVRP